MRHSGFNVHSELPASLTRLITEVGARLAHRPKIARQFAHCFPNTYATTMRRLDDGTTFVITGDIPAMWLRDSAAQVRPYLIPAATDPALADLLAGVVRRQLRYILEDPYANAFNLEPSRLGHRGDWSERPLSPWVWERKYEVDSLCYPLQLAYLLWRATGRADHLDDTYRQAVDLIIEVWRREQQHESASRYRFQRPFYRRAKRSDTLPRGGKGSLTAVTGMTWSGFRPSDDACHYGYLLPSNMFAVVVLGYVAEIAERIHADAGQADAARRLAREIDDAIHTHGIVEHPRYGPIYAYETDGFGNRNLMDDANVPSLLAIPYLGYADRDDPLYHNTRRFVLGPGNPYFFQGCAAAGVGSPHTPRRYIWHLALAMQGLTARDPDERERLLDLFERTDAGTNLMHEGFHADNPARFTRPWFAWANALFSEFVLASCGLTVPDSPLADRTLQRPQDSASE